MTTPSASPARLPRLFGTLFVTILTSGLLGATLPARAEIAFRDAAERWGLVFEHDNGAEGRLLLPETFGSGVVLFDYDGDGDPDVLFVDSGPLGEAGSADGTPPGGRPRLFRNEGGGRFVDATDAAGIRQRGYGMGAAAGDVDGDGDLDLFLTAYGPDTLLVNQGDGTFRDGTARAGLEKATPGKDGGASSPWSTSAAFADVEGDGDLDLYVASYVTFDLEKHPLCGESESGLRSYCHPALFPGQADRFFRNRGDGTFEEVTLAAGFRGETGGPPDGKGLGVIFGDVDGDGHQDLYVANDTTPNFLFRGRGDGTFEDLSLFSGTAFSAEGKAEAGMGVDFGDLDGDALPELVVTNFDMETNALYGNLGEGLFSDRRFLSRIAEPSLYRVGFGVALADLDFDGDLDLAVANGHILANIEVFPDKKGNTYRQPNQVLENRGGVFTPAPDLPTLESSRGLAHGDLDGDGDLDLVITNSDARAEVYENVTPRVGPQAPRALAVTLRAESGNRFAIGAAVRVETPAGPLTEEVRTGASYLSQHELTLRFGLGPAAEGEAEKSYEVEVRWPSGAGGGAPKRQVIRGVPLRSGGVELVLGRP